MFLELMVCIYTSLAMCFLYIHVFVWCLCAGAYVCFENEASKREHTAYTRAVGSCASYVCSWTRSCLRRCVQTALDEKHCTKLVNNIYVYCSLCRWTKDTARVVRMLAFFVAYIARSLRSTHSFLQCKKHWIGEKWTDHLKFTRGTLYDLWHSGWGLVK